MSDRTWDDGLVTHEAVGRGTVLVVDDDQIVVDMLSVRLGLEGFTVLTAADGATAIDALGDRTDVRVAVCDLELGAESGVDVLRRIRAVSPLTSGIVISGHPREIVQELLADPSVLTLQKPFSAIDLVAAIVSLCRSDYPNA